MPQSRLFIRTFKMLHDFRIRLGARPVHVAQYAKKWQRFYAYLRKNVMLNAVHYAAKHGFEAVTCGHTHYAEEQFINGIKYLNTGAWTEQPSYYVQVSATEIMLKKTTDTADWATPSNLDTAQRSSVDQQHPTQPISHQS